MTAREFLAELVLAASSWRERSWLTVPDVPADDPGSESALVAELRAEGVEVEVRVRSRYHRQEARFPWPTVVR